MVYTQISTKREETIMNLNQLTIAGNLGANPEIISLASGNKTTFSVATNEHYTDKNGNPKTETEWFSVVCWGNLADITAKYLKKGSSVFVQGKLKTRNYDDANGQKRYVTEVIASSIQFLDAKPQQMPQAQAPQQMPQAQAPQVQNQAPQQMPQAQAPQQIPNAQVQQAQAPQQMHSAYMGNPMFNGYTR